MKFSNLFKKTEQKDQPGHFSEFFLNASEDKKKEVFKEAVRMANKEQREVIERTRFKTKTG